MKHLSDIFLEGNSDKGPGFHNYTPKYHELFSPFRMKPIRLLELGFLGGDSLEAWAKFFPNAEIYGMDIMDTLYRPTNERIRICYGRAEDKNALDQIPGEFDILIDDAGHFAAQQIETFNLMWPRIKSGGLFIEEDVHTVHSAQHCDHPYNIINYFAKVACDIQDPLGAYGSARYNPEHPWSDIESIEMSKGLIVIRKRSA